MGLDLAAFDRLRTEWLRLESGRHRAGSAGQRYGEDPAAWTAHVIGLQATQRRLAGRGLWAHGPSTLMSVLQIARREVLNCRVARWLLDPLARHGLGTAMVAALGQQIGLDIGHPDRARSAVEVWRDNSRADLVIWGPAEAYSIVIEAKIGAGEGPEQGFRLEQDWLPPTDGGAPVHLIFLTTGGNKVPTTAMQPARWHPLRWTWFADTAERLLGTTSPPADGRGLQARHAVQEWVTSARRSLR